MRYYSDTAPSSTLSAGIDADDTSVSLTIPVHSQFAGYPFVLRLDPNTVDEELVLVTAGTNPYTVTRAWGSTTGKSHEAGAVVRHGVGSADLQDARDHEASGKPAAGATGAHGLPWTAWSPTGFYNIKDYGAVGNGSTNDSAAIQAAIDAVPDGGTLYIPRGTYLVGPTAQGSLSNAIFTRANGQRINIIGEGFASLLSVHASTPSTMDVIGFAWTTSTRGLRFENFAILPQSGHPGRHGIHFDLTSGTTVLVYQVVFRNLMLTLDNATGQGIAVNVNAASVSGGMAYSVIEECLLDGIRLNNVGDNMKVSHNTLIPTNSTNPTVYVVNITGAKNFVFNHNVVAGRNAMLYHAGGYSSVIDGNWFETPSGIANASSHGAMVDIAGDVSDVKHIKIRNNSFMSHVGTNLPNPIRLDNCIQGLVDGNFLWTYGFPDYAAIKLTANAEDNTIGANTYEEGNVVKYQEDCVDNLGVRTVFTVQTKTSWTPTISFGGGSTGITYGTRTGSVVKHGSVVTFSAVIPLTSKGSSTGNLSIGNLPYAAERDSPISIEMQTITSGVGDTNISAFVVGGFGTFSIRKMVSGTDTALTDADLTNSTTIRIAGSYLTSA